MTQKKNVLTHNFVQQFKSWLTIGNVTLCIDHNFDIPVELHYGGQSEANNLKHWLKNMQSYVWVWISHILIYF